MQLVGPSDDRVVERAPAREEVRTRSDRVFRLSAVVSVPAGEYTLRSTRSPFSHPQALVAVGEEPVGAWQRDLGYGAGGALLLLVGGTVVLMRTRRDRP